MKQSAGLSKYSQMYSFCKSCIPKPLFDILIQEIWAMLTETGYHASAWLQTQLISGQNHTGNVERRMSSWSQVLQW